MATSHKILILLFLALFAGEFLVRGPVRFLRERGFNDFISTFVQAKAFISGADPYSPQEVLRFWPKDLPQPKFLWEDAAAGTIAAQDGIPSPYPLSCLAVLSPVSVLPWHIAHIVLFAFNVFCAVLLIGLLLSLAQLRPDDPRTYIFVGLALGMAPLHTALATGNLIVPVCACGLAAVWCATRNRPTLAGVLLALAICSKPQVGVIFLAYAVTRRRWNMAVVAACLSGFVSAAAIFRLWIAHTSWLHSYFADLNHMFATGAINDFTRANPLRFHLLNLQTPMFSVTGSSSAADEISWAMVAVLGLLWLGLIWQRDTESELLDLSAIATIALLPMYHRFVDAMLLLLPLCWCLTVRDKQLKTVSRLVMVLLLPFLVPGATLLTILAHSGAVPAPFTANWWWDAVIVPHETWAVLAVSVALLCAMHLKTKAAQLAIDVPAHTPTALAELPQT